MLLHVALRTIQSKGENMRISKTIGLLLLLGSASAWAGTYTITSTPMGPMKAGEVMQAINQFVATGTYQSADAGSTCGLIVGPGNNPSNTTDIQAVANNTYIRSLFENNPAASSSLVEFSVRPQGQGTGAASQLQIITWQHNESIGRVLNAIKLTSFDGVLTSFSIGESSPTGTTITDEDLGWSEPCSNLRKTK